MQFFRRRVYADAAASTPLSYAASRELVRLLSVYGNPGGLHKEATDAKREVEAARASVADVLGAHPDEIVFTSGGTEGNALAISGILSAIIHESWQPEVITSSIEHPSVLEPLRILSKEEKIVLRELPVDATGRILLDDLKDSINENTVLISIQLINSEIGTIQDIREIAKVVRHVKHNRIAPARALRAARPSPTLASSNPISLPPLLPLCLHTDASQAPLWLQLKVEKLGVDLMTLDGQKIMGPKGVGALFVKRGSVLMPMLLGGGQEGGLRSGTENVPLIGSFAKALAEAQEGVEARVKMISFVRDFLFSEIKKLIPTAILNGAEGEWRAANNCNISIPGLPGDMATLALDAEGVAASTRSACSTGDETPSHVLQAIGLEPEIARCTLRLTLLPDASMTDARFIAHTLKKVVNLYKKVL